MTTHISADVQRVTLNASCMTISDGRTEQLDIFCRVTGFTSDFLSFIVVEHIRFFHRALQFHRGLVTHTAQKSYFFSSLPNISTIYPPQHFVTSLTFRYPHPLYPEPHKVNALDTVAEQCSSDGQGMQSVNQAVCLLVAAGRQCCDDRLDRYHAETHRHNILLQCSTTNNNTAMRLDQQIHSHTLQSIYSITLLSFTHASGMV